MTVLKKFIDLLAFDIYVMIADFESVTDLLQLTYFCITLIFGKLLCPLVIVFAEIYDLCDWRIGVW
jgi:hypothetical protein